MAKALSRKAKISLAASAVALALGLYATHTMVPPTPGPVATAGLLKADLGLVILAGKPYRSGGRLALRRKVCSKDKYQPGPRFD